MSVLEHESDNIVIYSTLCPCIGKGSSAFICIDLNLSFAVLFRSLIFDVVTAVKPVMTQVMTAGRHKGKDKCYGKTFLLV